MVALNRIKSIKLVHGKFGIFNSIFLTTKLMLIRFFICSYDIKSKKWCSIASLKSARAAYGAAELNGLIYVAGGRINWHRALKSVECYDPVMDQWKEVSSMTSERSYFTLIEHQGYLYAVGGGPKTIERYDPVADIWTEVCMRNFSFKLFESFTNTIFSIFFSSVQQIGTDEKFQYLANATIAQNEIFGNDGQRIFEDREEYSLKFPQMSMFRSFIDRQYFFTPQ